MKKQLLILLIAFLGFTQAKAQCEGTSINFTIDFYGHNILLEYQGSFAGKCDYLGIDEHSGDNWDVYWFDNHWIISVHGGWGGEDVFTSTTDVGNRPPNFETGNWVKVMPEYEYPMLLQLDGSGTMKAFVEDPIITNVVGCAGAGSNNGSASITTNSFGVELFTYSWKNASDEELSTTDSVSNLSVGTYTVTVTDGTGEINVKTFTVTEPAALAVSSSQSNVPCNGFADGSASVSISGGTAPYTYSWSPMGGTSATASGLSAGTYTCTITDAIGCMTTQNFTITQPPSLIASAFTQSNVSCNGGSDGSATVSSAGGTSPYTYLWSNSATTKDLLNVSAGTYSVTVTDANGCTASSSVDVYEPAAFSNAVTQESGVLMATQANAIYQWYSCGDTSDILLDGETNQTFTPIDSGSYKVAITVGSCTMESDCISISTLGVNDLKISKLNVFPNPTTGIVHINTSKEMNVEVYDPQGKLIKTQKINDEKDIIDFSRFNSGVYFIKTTDMDGNSTIQKIIKQ